MAIHSCESDFRVICGIDSCTASFRRYGAYKKHVYRAHRKTAGVATAASGEGTARNDEDAGVEIPVNDTGSDRNSCDDGDSASGDSEESPSGGCSTKEIQEQLVLFYLKITEKLRLPFTTADEIFSVMKSLIQQVLDGHTQRTLKLLVEENVASFAREKVSSALNGENTVQDMFSGLESTHLRKKFIAENFLHTDVTQVSLQTGNFVDTVAYIPVSKVLTNFLQSDMLECFMQPAPTPSDVLSDFWDGEFLAQCRDVVQDGTCCTIFLLLYTDELELTNPLGSAAGRHKILVVYFSILNIHPRHRSKLSAIHLLLLVVYPAVKRHGLEKVLAPLVCDLNRVHEDGIDFKGLRFSVVTVAFTGDNLSMHHLAGLQCSFSGGRVCRFCLARHKDLKELCSVDDCVDRTSAGHKSHLEAFAIDPARNGPLYGITGVSPLSGLKNFEVMEQLPPDAMHDILEGGVGVVLRQVLCGLVEDEVLKKEDLDKVKSFNYGHNDKKAAPVPVKETFLTGKACLRGTASQRWCLFRLLPQYFAESIPEGNRHWEVYLAYRHVVDIILAGRIPKDCVPYLQAKVEDFLELYTTQYPNAVVTPKLHYLLHYPKYLLKYGPARRFWGMRFEAKHSYFKNIALKAKNFRNICLTLATRHQLLQAYELSGNVLHCPLEVTGEKPVHITELPEDEQAVIAKATEEALFSSVATASLDSCHYRVGDVFVHGVQHDVPHFLKIVRIFVVCSSVMLLSQRLSTLQCSEHRCSYIVKGCDEKVVVMPDNVVDFYPLDLYRYGDEHEVVPHYAIF